MRFRNTSLGPSALAPGNPARSPQVPRHAPPTALTQPAAAVTPRSAAIPAAIRLNVVWWVTAALVLSHFGRIFERVLVGDHVPAILSSIGLVAVAASGAIKRINTRVGLAFCALCAWIMLGTPMSTWKGGSTRYLLTYLALWAGLLLLVAHAQRTAKDAARMSYVTLFSCAFFILAGGRIRFDRFESTGTWGNSNDIALMAGYCIPFLVLMASRIRNPVTHYLLLFGGCGLLLVAIGRTASRTSVLALAAMVAVYLVLNRGFQRIALLAGSAIAAIALFLYLPETTIIRLSTIMDPIVSTDLKNATEAGDSAAERRELLNDAIRISLEHPIFGIGMGEFLDYRSQHLKNPDGSNKRYFPSHNTYAQFAAETGIPGMLLYLFFLFSIHRTVGRTRQMALRSDHPEKKLVLQLTTAVEASLVYFAVFAFFMN